MVNYQDESSVQTGPQRHTLPGFVPSTSCFQLGRPGSASSCRAQLRCCLCGQTANILGLGDLHGPYCPTGTSEKGPTCRTEQEDFQNFSNGCLQNSEDGAKTRVLGTPGPRSPEVPAALDERWVHEDCSIWAAGVFLVRGKLYGLEEAARLAQNTVSWNRACSELKSFVSAGGHKLVLELEPRGSGPFVLPLLPHRQDPLGSARLPGS